MIERLIKIADLLDKLGNEEDADFMNDIIKDYKEDIIEIPEDEFEMLKMVHDSLMDSFNEKPDEDLESFLKDFKLS